MQRIYEFIEQQLPNEYDINYQNLDENKSKQIGIFLYQGQADQEWSDGTAYESIKVHIELNCDIADNGVIEAMSILRNTCINLKSALSDIDGLDVLDVTILNKAIPIGKNEHGIQKVVSNLEIKFILDGGN